MRHSQNNYHADSVIVHYSQPDVFFIASARAMAAVSLHFHRNQNSHSRKQGETRWEAIELSGQKIAAKQERNGARSGISAGYNDRTRTMCNWVRSSRSWALKCLKLKAKVSAGFHSRHFYSAAIAVTAFGALGVYPRTNRNAEDSNPGR